MTDWQPHQTIPSRVPGPNRLPVAGCCSIRGSLFDHHHHSFIPFFFLIYKTVSNTTFSCPDSFIWLKQIHFCSSKHVNNITTESLQFSPSLMKNLNLDPVIFVGIYWLNEYLIQHSECFVLPSVLYWNKPPKKLYCKVYSYTPGRVQDDYSPKNQGQISSLKRYEYDSYT